ncbi:unnamed protein product [Ectocarpus sp. 12 AP-2014]
MTSVVDAKERNTQHTARRLVSAVHANKLRNTPTQLFRVLPQSAHFVDTNKEGERRSSGSLPYPLPAKILHVYIYRTHSYPPVSIPLDQHDVESQPGHGSHKSN